MADEQQQKKHSGESVDAEVKDRGLFDFMGRKNKDEEKEEKKCNQQEEVLVTEFEKVQVADPEETKKVDAAVEEKKPGLLEKLHRSHSGSSSSSSDEEEAAEGENKGKKKKKGLKEKIKEKMSGEGKKEGEEKKAEQEVVTTGASPATAVVEDSTVPVEKLEETAIQGESEVQEKKGFLEKIKEKFPGGGHQKKPAEEGCAASPTPATECAHEQGKEHEGEGQSPKEKKGILGKIMDKIPGYNKTDGAEESGASH